MKNPVLLWKTADTVFAVGDVSEGPQNLSETNYHRMPRPQSLFSLCDLRRAREVIMCSRWGTARLPANSPTKQKYRKLVYTLLHIFVAYAFFGEYLCLESHDVATEKLLCSYCCPPRIAWSIITTSDRWIMLMIQSSRPYPPLQKLCKRFRDHG